MLLLGELFGKPIPEGVIASLETGDQEILSNWMAAENILPNDKDWKRTNLSKFPPHISSQLQGYQYRQEDFISLRALISGSETSIPKTVMTTFLQTGNTTSIIGWMSNAELKPNYSSWITYEEVAESNTSIKKDLMKYRETQLETDVNIIEKATMKSISSTVVQAMKDGNSTGIEALLLTQLYNVSEESWSTINITQLTPSFGTSVEKIRTRHNKIKAFTNLVQSNKATVIPSHVATDFVKTGNTSLLQSWMIKENILPSYDAWNEYQNTGKRQDDSNEILLLQTRQVNSDVELIQELTGMTVGNVSETIIQTATGDALKHWLGTQHILSSSEAWASLDFSLLTPQLARQLRSYKFRQEELEILQSLVNDKIPANVSTGLLLGAGAENTVGWMHGRKLTSDDDKWTEVLSDPSIGNSTMDLLLELKKGLEKCPDNPQHWGFWTEWTECPVTCGRGNITRQMIHVNTRCPPKIQTSFCHLPYCPQEPTMDPEMVRDLEMAGIEDASGDPMALGVAATDTLPFYLSQLDPEERMKLGHSLQDTVPLCTYDGQRCPREDWRTSVDEMLGNCFTYNFHDPPEKIASRPGQSHGLSVLLQSQQDEYLCSSQAETVNLAPPYGSCSPDPPPNFLYNGSFTIEGCLRSCYQEELTQMCGCADPRLTIPNGVSPCPLDQKPCLDFFQNCNGNDDGQESLCPHCTTPCRSSEYELTLSTSPLNTGGVLENLCGLSDLDSVNKSCSSVNSKRRNFAMVHLYYDRLVQIVYEEAPDYDVTRLMSDMAGILGITLGCSVITFSEILYLSLDLVVFLLSKRTQTLL